MISAAARTNRDRKIRARVTQQHGGIGVILQNQINGVRAGIGSGLSGDSRLIDGDRAIAVDGDFVVADRLRTLEIQHTPADIPQFNGGHCRSIRQRADVKRDLVPLPKQGVSNHQIGGTAAETHVRAHATDVHSRNDERRRSAQTERWTAARAGNTQIQIRPGIRRIGANVEGNAATEGETAIAETEVNGDGIVATQQSEQSPLQVGRDGEFATANHDVKAPGQLQAQHVNLHAAGAEIEIGSPGINAQVECSRYGHEAVPKCRRLAAAIQRERGGHRESAAAEELRIRVDEEDRSQNLKRAIDPDIDAGIPDGKAELRPKVNDAQYRQDARAREVKVSRIPKGIHTRQADGHTVDGSNGIASGIHLQQQAATERKSSG